MKIKWGALVVEGRGKVGGQVASRNRSGAYMRNKVSPVNPNTSFQNTVRSRLTTLAQGWRDLTQVQRDGWNAAVSGFAKTDVFGDLKNPTGFNLYQRLNNNLLAVGLGTIDDAPIPSEVETRTIGALTVDVGVGDAITLALSGVVPADTHVEVWMTPGLSPGKSFVQSEYRLLQSFDSADPSPLDVQAAYESRFGSPAEGTKVFARIKFVNDTTGQASQYQSTSTIVVST